MEKLRHQILKRFVRVINDRIPMSVKVTAKCGQAIERTVHQIRHSDNPAQALNAFVSQWAEN